METEKVCDKLMKWITGNIIKKEMKWVIHLLDISFIWNESQVTQRCKSGDWDHGDANVRGIEGGALMRRKEQDELILKAQISK